MSFGVSATDVLSISALAWKIYKTCKESSDEFKRVSTEVSSLHVILKETEELLSEDYNLTDARRSRLAILLETSGDLLKDLDGQLSKYESLGTHSQRTWDRLRWGLEDVSDVRSRLICVSTMLAAFNSSLANSSQARIEKRLEKFIAEVRAGLREGSVVSSHPPQNLESSDCWSDLQRELEDVGLSAAMVSEHQQYIKSWFKQSIELGLLDGTAEQATPPDDGSGSPEIVRAPGDQDHGSPMSPASSTAAQSDTTLVGVPTTSQAEDLFEKPPLRRSRTTVQDIDCLLSRDDPPFPDLPPPTRSDTSQSHSPTILLRKHSYPSKLFFRTFLNDHRLLQEASDGSLKGVATLLSRGANINVRDKWGWTPLSMAAYGGHETISKLLLACGAEIETADVDGDSPLDLATNRGHTSVVIAIQDEQANRVLNGPPAPLVGGKRKDSKTGAGARGRPVASAGPPGPSNSPDVHSLRRSDSDNNSPSRMDSSITLQGRHERGIRSLTRKGTTEFGPLKKSPTFHTRGSV